jgi:polyisoprenoid-binding protein YceI
MKRKPFLILALLVLSLATQSRAADTYNIDPAHSSVGFAITHMVINTVHGHFNQFSGTVAVDGKSVSDAKGTVDTKSVDTGQPNRDKHLKSADFFDAEKFPTITFASKRADKKDGETVLVGDFTMHGVTKELSLPVKLSGPIKDPMGMNRIGLHGKTKINRKDYGISYNKAMEAGGLMLGEEVEIEINAEAVKK